MRRRKTEKIINNSPIIAEVSLSWLALSFSGSPAEVRMPKAEKSISRKAIPPAMPMAQLMNFVTKAPGSVGIQPIAVWMPVSPSHIVGLMVGVCVLSNGPSTCGIVSSKDGFILHLKKVSPVTGRQEVPSQHSAVEKPHG